jgi:hypothetical protein
MSDRTALRHSEARLNIAQNIKRYPNRKDAVNAESFYEVRRITISGARIRQIFELPEQVKLPLSSLPPLGRPGRPMDGVLGEAAVRPWRP